jgi:hypothetical protein
MKNSLLVLFVFFIQFSSCKNYDKEVHKNIGKNYTYCGKVEEVFLSRSHAFLNFGGKYPNQKFTGYLPSQGRNFSYDIKSLEGEEICITGKVEIYRGRAEIVITDEKQIQF